jgi:hypothetical protein
LAEPFHKLQEDNIHWYSRTLRSLEPGHRVWACIPKTGYVGVGIVEAPVVKIDEFTVEQEDGTEKPLSRTVPWATD